MQILVLGPHRSGTSAVAGLLELMGAYFGDEIVRMPARPDNPKGFWERNDVVAINDRILSAAGGSWRRVHSLDFRDLPASECSEIHYEISQLIEELDAHQPWMIKDPRLCLTFPLWKAHLRKPVVLLVHRDPIEVALSLFRRNGLPIHVGLALWEVYVKSAQMAAADLPRVSVFYSALLQDPASFSSNLTERLRAIGVQKLRVPGASELHELIDPALHHESGSTHLMEEYLNPKQKRFWNSINSSEVTSTVEVKHLMDVSPGALRALSDFSEVQARLEAIESLERRHAQELEREKVRDIEELEKVKERDAQEIEKVKERDAQELEREKARHAQELKAERETHAQELEAEREHYIQRIWMLDHWLREVSGASNSVFSSLRWRTGTIVARCIETLTFRRRSPTARDHIDMLISEFRAWRASHASQYGLDDTTVPAHSGEFAQPAEISVRALLSAMLRQPVKTLQLANPERVRNFFITCFKQPGHVRREIIHDYLDRYDVHTNRTKSGLRQRRPEIPLMFPEVETPEVSVIIPVFNQFDSTLLCLTALKENAAELQYEVILADDASTDNTQGIEAYCNNLRIVRSDNNRGFVDNCNMGATEAMAEWLFFLNNDAYVEKDCLSSLLSLARQDDSIGVVGPKLVYPDGRLQEAGGIVWCDGSAWNYGRGDDASRPEYNYVREVDYISGAAILVRRSLWRSVGGFDSSFSPAYYEDTDLAFQARKQGYKVLYQPAAVVTHEEGVSHGTDQTQSIKKHQVMNQSTFLDKWRTELERSHYRPGESLFQARERGFKKSTVLVIDQYVPEFDKDAGSRSTLQYLQLLTQRGARVKFLPDNLNKREPYTSTLQQIGIEVLYGDWYAREWTHWWRANRKYFDVVYLHRPHIAKRYIDEVRRCSNVRIIYFGHDLHYLRLERQHQVTADSSLLPEVIKWRQLEYEVIGKSDVVYYPAEFEVDEVKKQFPGKDVRVIPLNIYRSVEGPNSGFSERAGIFFIGGFRHPPNLDGVRWLVKEVLPQVVERISSVRLVIAGSRMPEEVAALECEHVDVKGSVSEAELEGLYAKMRLVVVPLRFGAGVKGKILEAMRHRVPVVTTSIGAEGLPEPVDYLEIADDANDFAQRITELYNDSRRWEMLAERGSEVIRKHFSQERALAVVAQDFGI